MSSSKIVLKTTTKMSLNERFTTYRQAAQTEVGLIRQKMQQQRQASVKNRRLAQQMANRPSVIAALKLKKRSLQQRLGQKAYGSTGVKSRLTLTSTPIQGRLGSQTSGFGRGKGVIAVRGGLRRPGGGRGSNRVRPGTSPMLKARLGVQTNSGNKSFQSNSGQRGGQNRRGQNRNFRRRKGRGNFGKGYRQQQQQQQQRRGGGGFGQFRNQSGRGGRGFRRQGGRGRGRGINRRYTVPSRQELDNQLDEYMAKTKTSLDQELEQYMTQA